MGTSNVYARRVLSGEFQVVNPHLLRDLTELGLWSSEMKERIINDNGSVQRLDIPEHIKELYKTVWEIKQKNVLKMAADRGPFIDQSQSLNVHIAAPKYGTLTSMHFMGWKLGLKTGMYYLRTKPAAAAIKFTANKENEMPPVADIKLEVKSGEVPTEEDIRKLNEAALVCSLENKEACMMCSS